jgi:hypothetical protein
VYIPGSSSRMIPVCTPILGLVAPVPPRDHFCPGGLYMSCGSLPLNGSMNPEPFAHLLTNESCAKHRGAEIWEDIVRSAGGLRHQSFS